MPVPEVPPPGNTTPAGRPPAGRPPAGVARRWVPVVVSLLLGVAVGVLGTVLHTNLAWLGGIVLPWGAVLALLLVASAQLWWTLNSSLAWTGGVMAVAAFTTALVMASWPGLDTFSVALNDYTLRMLPGPAIAGAVWLWGIPVVAVITMLVAQPLLRAPAPRD